MAWQEQLTAAGTSSNGGKRGCGKRGLRAAACGCNGGKEPQAARNMLHAACCGVRLQTLRYTAGATNNDHRDRGCGKRGLRKCPRRKRRWARAGQAAGGTRHARNVRYMPTSV
eukprot:8537648-Alexandrium_andersonii.AAC.1